MWTWFRKTLARAEDLRSSLAKAEDPRQKLCDHAHKLAKVLKKQPDLVPPWEAAIRTNYICVTPPSGWTKNKGSVVKEYASECLANFLLNGRKPGELTTAEATWSRMNKLFDRCLPGYTSLFRIQYTAQDLLQKHAANVDLALFEALWRYSLAWDTYIFLAACTIGHGLPLRNNFLWLT